MSDYERIAREALERAEKATEGPWYSSGDAIPYSPKQKLPFDDQGAAISTQPDEDCWGGDVVEGGNQDEQGGAVGVLRNEDAEFIAHARQDVPDLARAVLDQQKTIERQHDEIRHLAREKYEYDGNWTEAANKAFEFEEKCERLEKEVERLQSELRIEKASQATRGNT